MPWLAGARNKRKIARRTRLLCERSGKHDAGVNETPHRPHFTSSIYRRRLLIISRGAHLHTDRPAASFFSPPSFSLSDSLSCSPPFLVLLPVLERGFYEAPSVRALCRSCYFRRGAFATLYLPSFPLPRNLSFFISRISTDDASLKICAEKSKNAPRQSR